jgi:hypothetical protein
LRAPEAKANQLSQGFGGILPFPGTLPEAAVKPPFLPVNIKRQCFMK